MKILLSSGFVAAQTNFTPTFSILGFKLSAISFQRAKALDIFTVINIFISIFFVIFFTFLLSRI
tara:strand:+ start:123 stop:314 length:192 start_codon:yes stop_codon:yes gene_type:complete